ncbi:hypothetical protein [Actinoallomurus rhizosphaericola]|uniref:hypothetical protein n=1 Tax=Actinoallomurus rhizosphaericola TaxID=2952536 RepID=UPI002090CAE7|nr:hypothetical protein [Actinoallomurus rhizosphaericola]MCO5992218.1 hypothetical protein [Actinoallomurus rhizosphaericola]
MNQEGGAVLWLAAFDRFPEAVEGAVRSEVGVEVLGERLGGGLVGEFDRADPLAGAAEGVGELTIPNLRSAVEIAGAEVICGWLSLAAERNRSARICDRISANSESEGRAKWKYHRKPQWSGRS